MNLIKNKWFLNASVMLVSILVTLLIANGLAAWWVKNKARELSETSGEATMLYLSDDFVAFRNKFNVRLHHMRGYKAFRDGAYAPHELLYTLISPYSSQGPNVLFQGDSWAEQANSAEGKRLLANYAAEYHAGLVSAGVGSYAPSPMAMQLRILRDDFGFEPTTLIAYIDQTDISDEFYRYSETQVDENGRIISMLPPASSDKARDRTLYAQRDQVLRSNQLALIKLFKYKMLRKAEIEIETGDPNGEDILKPLVTPDAEMSRVFIARLDRYINEFFSSTQARRMVFVTHPHKRHLLSDSDPSHFSGNVVTLVDQCVGKSRWAKQISHINITERFSDVYGAPDLQRDFFRENDEFSHLSDNTYNQKFLPYLLKTIKPQ